MREIRPPGSVRPKAEWLSYSTTTDLSFSKLADQVGAYAAVLKPVHALIEAHVLAAKRLHDDCATVPIVASGKAYIRTSRYGEPCRGCPPTLTTSAGKKMADITRTTGLLILLTGWPDFTSSM
ncbi:hypothetical protein NKH71_32380 [Mesorhizobium sp. M0983]|uniref:hypothetical protein n=1 Tax=Mesorhizobium sp. M0983 TaxID=2957040 RepID=UPI00333D85B8